MGKSLNSYEQATYAHGARDYVLKWADANLDADTFRSTMEEFVIPVK